MPKRRRYGYEIDRVTTIKHEATVVQRMFAHETTGGSIRSLA